MSASPERAALLASIREERLHAIDYVIAKFPEERDFMRNASDCLRRVVVILGSPRGGTSAVKELIRNEANVQSLPGEHRLIFTLLGMNYPDHGLSTECRPGPISPHEVRFFLRNLYFECQGDEAPLETARDLELYGWRWALRFRLQWPTVDRPLEWIVALVYDAIKSHHSGTTQNGIDCAYAVLAEMQQRGLPVLPWCYDLDPKQLKERFGDMPRIDWCTPTIIEISPFIPLVPTRRRRLVPGQALLLKASSDAFRIQDLQHVFADHEVSFIHLTRNPVAAINGLLDGWDDRCFWQHHVPGHTEPSKLRYWCFDLVDGWRDIEELTDVCQLQWAEPHQRILAADLGSNMVRVAFEDFQRGGAERLKLRDRIMQLARIPALPGPGRTTRIVNQTAPPQARRWEASRPWLLERIRTPIVEQTASSLGYDFDRSSAWL